MNPPSRDTVERAIGAELLRARYAYCEREAILYALGVGAPADWLAPDELKFVHELQPDYQVLPTFAVIFAKDLHELVLGGDIAGIKFNPMLLVHGEQQLTLAKPLPRAAVVESTVRVMGAHDKGSGLLLTLEVESRDEAGGLLAEARTSMFIRGLGGFGGDRGLTRKSRLPEWPPDAVLEETTLERQALIYRLAGDANPLHVDPQMAAIGNFDKPILHGLCTLGFSARAILKQFCGNDTHRLAAISARFAHHVFPGETLVTEMWDTGGGTIRFQTKTKERDAVVLNQASAQLRR